MKAKFTMQTNKFQHALRKAVMPAFILLALIPVSVLAQTINHPQGAHVDEGDPAMFDFSITGGAVEYQWQVSTNGGVTWANVSGSNYIGGTTNTLTIISAPLFYDGYQYRCAYRISIGVPFDYSDHATLFVYAVPKITSHPANRSISEGGNASFSITTAHPELFHYLYQWQHSSDGGYTFSDMTNGGIYSGTTTSQLSLTNVPIYYDDYQYRCIVRLAILDWDNWVAYSYEATLTVVGSQPYITTPSLPEGIKGTSYIADLAATGTKPITWSIIAGSLPPGLSLNATSGRIYGTPTTTGPLQFTVKATNGLGEDTKEFTMNVVEPPPQVLIEVTSPAEPICTVNESVSIPFNILETAHPMRYSILFSEEAKAAGFKDITSQTDLPDVLLLHIDIPENVPSQLYAGVVIITCEGLDNYRDEYPFTFTVINNGVAIINQPPAFQSLCGGATVALAVDVSGTTGSYQWYKNGLAITGAVNNEYIADTEGNYYVEVMGACGVIRSGVSVVALPSSVIAGVIVRVKWGNVLYVENAADQYDHYQWYKNGTAVNGATSIYLYEREGFLGDYVVRCYKADGSYDETCPVVFDVNSRSSAVAVYPTLLKSNDALNINLTDADFETEATVEIYSLLGIKVYATRITTSTATIRPDFRQKGNYFVKIILPTGDVVMEKIIVQ